MRKTRGIQAGILLICLLMLLTLAACQGKEEAGFELGAIAVEESRLVVEIEMSEEMIAGIDMDRYSSDTNVANVRLQDSSGKNVDVGQQVTQLSESLTMNANGKTLEQLVLVTTFSMENSVLEELTQDGAVISILGIKIADKRYENYSLSIEPDDFIPPALSDGTYRGALAYENMDADSVVVLFTVSGDGNMVSDLTLLLTGVDCYMEDTIDPSEFEDMPEMDRMVLDQDMQVRSSFDESGIVAVEVSPDISATVFLEGEYPVEDGVLIIDNAYFYLSGEVTSSGELVGEAEFTFIYHMAGTTFIKNYGMVEVTAVPE